MLAFQIINDKRCKFLLKGMCFSEYRILTEQTPVSLSQVVLCPLHLQRSLSPIKSKMSSPDMKSSGKTLKCPDDGS